MDYLVLVEVVPKGIENWQLSLMITLLMLLYSVLLAILPQKIYTKAHVNTPTHFSFLWLKLLNQKVPLSL